MVLHMAMSCIMGFLTTRRERKKNSVHDDECFISFGETYRQLYIIRCFIHYLRTNVERGNYFLSMSNSHDGIYST